MSIAALLAAPPAHAQQAKIWRIGFMSGLTRPPAFESSIYGGFLRGMRELGYVEGKTHVVEWRFAEGNYERFDDFSQEFVRMKVDVVVAGSTPAALAAQRATKTVPIVMGAVGDPVGTGLVASLARPGGNVTGISQNLAEIAPKLLELVRAIRPAASRVAVLVDPGNQSNVETLKSLQSSARKISILSMEARAPEDIDQLFVVMVRERADAVVVLASGLFILRRQQIVKAALSHRLPSVFQLREDVEEGGLASYGQSLTKAYQRAATYVDRILKGARPGDLPIEQPDLFELILNLKTARALGIDVPLSVQRRADRVIE